MGNERGFGFLLAIVTAAFMLLFGLAVSFSSMTEFAMSSDMSNNNIAITTADAGYNTFKNTLRGIDISTILQTTTQVPRYIDYPEPPPGSQAEVYFSRNPLAPLEAIHVDFESPPPPIDSRTVFGLLTPAEGVPLGSNGRFWVKITDNDDGDGDENSDEDGAVYMRVLGIKPALPGQMTTYGGSTKNAIAILEGMLKRDMTLDLSAPFTVYGENASPAQGNNLFAGASFELDGYDHPTATLWHLVNNKIDTTDPDSVTHTTGGSSAGFDALYDDPGDGDASELVSTVYDDLNPVQKMKITGNTSDYGSLPSLRDGTQEVRADTNEDAAQIFDPNYVMNFVNKMESVADLILPDGTNYSESLGGDGSIDPSATPQITYCAGDCTLSGGATGAGLLIVRGRLDLPGGLNFRGLILALGDVEIHLTGSNRVLGGVFVARVRENIDGTYYYDEPRFTVSGNSHFYFQGSGIRMGYSLMPMRTVTWREITPELEPTF